MGGVGVSPLAGSSCPLCRASSRIWMQAGSRDLRRCDRCAFLWVPQGVVHAAGVTIYEQDPPIFLQDGNADYYLDDSNLLNAEEKLAWVQRLAPAGGALLDVGANFGHFAAVARASWQVTALEPSPVAVRWAAAHLNVPVEVGSIDDAHPEFVGRFNVATMWDVLEHLPDPARALETLRRYLRPHCVLFVTTPDAGSLVARLMRRHWHYLDLVQHVAVFNRGNLTRLLEQAGFRIRALRHFGRIYRTSYVAERVDYLARSKPLWRVLRAGARPGLRLAPAHLRINLGDVIGVAAEVVS